MSRRSWFPSLRSRLQPLSRRQRRRGDGKRVSRFQELELRSLLTTVTPSESTASFSVTNHSQFGSGNALVSSGDYFLGAQNFDTGTQTVGGYLDPSPPGGKTGVQASVDLNGTAGLDLGYSINSGSISAAYNSNLSQSFDDPTALGTVPIDTSGTTLTNGTLSTQSPSVGVYADADVQLGGSVNVNASAFGDSSSGNLPINASLDQELFSLNRNNDQTLKVMGEPDTVSHTFSVPVSETPPISIDTTVSTTNQPLGASQSMSVSLSKDYASLSANLGTASESVPVVQLNASQNGSNPALSASTTDGPDTQLANLQVQMGVLASAALNLPPAATAVTVSAGPGYVTMTPLSFQLGPTVYAHQSVSVTPVETITYNFDHQVWVSLNNAPAAPMSQVTFTPGEPLSIKFDGTPIHVTPTLNLELQFHNKIDIDVNVNATLTAGQLSVGLSGVPGWVQSALGLPLTTKPLYQHKFDIADAPAVTAFDQTFDILNQSQTMSPFVIGANYQSSLQVTSCVDPNTTGGTLRAAVNNADAHPSADGDVIYLGPHTYSLTDVVGTGGTTTDDGTVGNLLVTDPNLTLVGAGAGQTTIDASGLGDRAFQVAPGAGLHLEGLTITGGYANNGVPNDGTLGRTGGGILNDQGTLTLDHVDVSQNSAPEIGGGIYNADGQATITNSTIESNSAPTGGGLSAFGTNILIENSTLKNNAASSSGGAINDVLGATTIVTSQLSGNTAGEGGAIAQQGGQLIATDDYFKSNSASSGGAVMFTLFSNLNGSDKEASSITGSTFSQNSATGWGGAIDDATSANPITLTNCTLADNQANDGGGMFTDVGATIDSSTFYGNSATDAGGGIGAAGNPVLHDDIVAGNNTSNTGPDISGGIASQGYNFVGDGSDASGLVGSDHVGGNGNPILNPELGPLRDNGGATPTMILLAGSPAIGAGDTANNPTTDQRGFPRPSGKAVDIGAIQSLVSPLLVPNLSDDNITVSGSTVTQNITLRDAIDTFDLQGGTNEIDLVAGTYTLTATAANPTPTGHFGALVVGNEDLTIVGAGAGQTIIDASALGDRAFQVLSSGHLHLIGVTITGGNASGNGGAIDNEGTLSLKDSSVANSVSGGLGGAIFSDTGTALTLDDATISGNSAENGGGVAIINAASAAISDGATISGNIANADGGGIAVMGTLTITGSTITGNSAGQLGGGIVTNSSSSTVTLSQGTLSNNTAQVGGALFSNSPVVIDDSTLIGNVAQGAAAQGGSWIWGGFTRYGVGGGGGGAGLGAAIYNESILTLSNSTLVGNRAVGGQGGRVDTPGVSIGGAGGGLQGGAGGNASDGAAGQSASGGGGGGSGAPPYNGGAGGFGGGGGGSGGLTEGLLHSYTATGQGGAGGQYAGAGGSEQQSTDPTLGQITYPGGGGGGAGIGGALFENGQATLLNDTIVDNGASGGQGGLAINASAPGGLAASGAPGTGVGGGIYVYAGSVTSQNTVLAGNTANQDPDVSGTFTSNGHNFVGNVGSASGFVNQTNGDQVGGAPHLDLKDPTKTDYYPVIDPKLGPLQNNGGTTLTEMPLAGSPLIDAGSNSGVSATDQRGDKRIVGGTVDIGAVENQTLYVNTTADQLGARSLRQAVADADALGGQQTITLAAGTYQLKNLGHLDVHGVNLSIVGAGAGQTIIDSAQANDRDFQVAGGATLQLSGLTVENGHAGKGNGDGGDILNSGTLVISRSELKGGSAVYGGAISNATSSASLSIVASTLDGNTASEDGGAVVNFSGGMSITNTTISGDTARIGGAIASANPANSSISLINDTIAGNSATLEAGGVYSQTENQQSRDTFGLKNSLIAGNQAPSAADVLGTFLSQGHNLIGNVGNASGFGASGDQLGGAGNATIDPQLGSLQNNGGSTLTMLPAANSPAVDAGDNSGAPSTDQRGIRRPLGGTVDIGAVEAVFLTGEHYLWHRAR
jgi:hypothetical protein